MDIYDLEYNEQPIYIYIYIYIYSKEWKDKRLIRKI